MADKKIKCVKCSSEIWRCINCGKEFEDGGDILCVELGKRHYCSNDCFIEDISITESSAKLN